MRRSLNHIKLGSRQNRKVNGYQTTLPDQTQKVSPPKQPSRCKWTGTNNLLMLLINKDNPHLICSSLFTHKALKLDKKELMIFFNHPPFRCDIKKVIKNVIYICRVISSKFRTESSGFPVKTQLLLRQPIILNDC